MTGRSILVLDFLLNKTFFTRINKRSTHFNIVLRYVLIFLFRSLVSYSSGCGGQNKNITIIGLYSELHLCGIYEVLDHKFLVRGHTLRYWLQPHWEAKEKRHCLRPRRLVQNCLGSKPTKARRTLKTESPTSMPGTDLSTKTWMALTWGCMTCIGSTLAGVDTDPVTGIKKMCHHPDKSGYDMVSPETNLGRK